MYMAKQTETPSNKYVKLSTEQLLQTTSENAGEQVLIAKACKARANTLERVMKFALAVKLKAHAFLMEHPHGAPQNADLGLTHAQPAYE